ncbi:hypothetical protein BDZ94DRAFT_1305826 [Collybia nuda]|uniref:DUF6534 domain-containing protein n=1 Tax=Collybia nuda TaxID=64659 RepID=A0A9P5YDP2_9AGAR|nr:hypothetical protein BDZ94DRAFT_1305826 [Collybia nuda]
MAAAPPPVVLLVGPILVGVCLNWLLWGILTVQVYYYTMFFKDSIKLKSLVYGLYIADSAQTMIAMHSGFRILCTHWGNINAVISPGWTFCVVPIFSGIISFPVQAFFAHRIWGLRKSYRSKTTTMIFNVVIVFILACAAMQAISSIITGGQLIVINDIQRFSELNTVISIWLAGSCVCDITITLTMLVLLRKVGKKTQWHHTKSVINNLIQQTVETGLVTTVTALLELIFFLAEQNTSLHTTMAYMLAKLYTNTLMATLNSRIQNRATNEHAMALRSSGQNSSGGGIDTRHNRSVLQPGHMTGPQTVIQVDKIHQLHRDELSVRLVSFAS